MLGGSIEDEGNGAILRPDFAYGYVVVRIRRFVRESVMNCKLLVLSAVLFGASALPSFAQGQDEVEFVTKFFDELQPKSIAENREYCGFFGLDSNDKYVATKPTLGNEGSCYADDPPENIFIFASYHTHGGFSYDFGSEVPSSNDLEADIAEEIDGYVATPGGRIWFNNRKDQMAHLLCGRNCTVSDSDYDADGVKSINNSYTVPQLLRREAE